MIEKGLSNKPLFEPLQVTAETVKSRIKNIYRKLVVNGRRRPPARKRIELAEEVCPKANSKSPLHIPCLGDFFMSKITLELTKQGDKARKLSKLVIKMIGVRLFHV
jgi:hypothetical protein